MPRLLTGITLLLIFTACETVPTGGASWSRVFFTPSSARDLMFDTDVSVYATDRGLFVSTDFKRFHRPSADLPGDPEIISLAGADGIAEIYAVTDLGYLLRSNDRAQSFAMIGQFPNTRVVGMALTRNGQLFVASSSGVLVSTQNLTGAPARRARAYLMPWETLVLGLPIWRRANLSGDTDLWKDWSVSLDGNAIRIEADPDNGDHMIAELFRAGAHQTWDEGMTWNPIVTEEGDTVRGPIAFGPDSRVLIGRFLSRDGGRTWHATALVPDPEDMMQSRDVEFAAHSAAITGAGLYVVQYRAGKVYVSNDGTAWRRIGQASDFRAREKETAPALLAVDALGKLWLATDRHGLYRFVDK